MLSAFGVDHGDSVSKADRSSGNPSAGRRAMNAAFGPYHMVAISPSGRKFKNTAEDIGSSLAGAAPGAVLYGAGLKGLTTKGSAKVKVNTVTGQQVGPKKITPKGKKSAAMALGGAALMAGGGMAGRQINMARLNREGKLKAEEK